MIENDQNDWRPWSIHTVFLSQRFQKSPPLKPFSKYSVFVGVFGRICVNDRSKRIKKYTFSNENTFIVRLGQFQVSPHHISDQWSWLGGVTIAFVLVHNWIARSASPVFVVRSSEKNNENIVKVLVNKGLLAYIWCILSWTGYLEDLFIRIIFSFPADLKLTGFNCIPLPCLHIFKKSFKN